MERESHVRLAERYGLNENASWDDIYESFLSQIRERRAVLRAGKAGFIGCSPLLLFMYFWLNWFTLGLAIMVFLVVFVLFFWGYSHESSEHAKHMLKNPQIQKRAHRDKLFGE